VHVQKLWVCPRCLAPLVKIETDRGEKMFGCQWCLYVGPVGRIDKNSAAPGIQIDTRSD